MDLIRSRCTPSKSKVLETGRLLTVLLCERVHSVHCRPGGFRGKPTAQRCRVRSACKSSKRKSSSHKVPVLDRTARTALVIHCERIVAPASPSAVDFVPLMRRSLPLVWCHEFILPFSHPLFSTYLTGESHREVKFISL